MAIIAVYGRAAGIGKTTVATNISWMSAEIYDNQTLLWDLDSEGDATRVLSAEDEQPARFRSALAFDVGAEMFLRQTCFKRLHLLPADSSLKGFNHLNASSDFRGRFRRLLDQCRSRFTHVILDCPSGYSALADEAIDRADFAILPLLPSGTSLRGLSDLQREIDQVRNGTVLIPTYVMIERGNPQHRELLAGTPDFPVIPSFIPEAEGPAHFDPAKGDVREAFTNLWGLLGKGNLAMASSKKMSGAMGTHKADRDLTT